MHTRHHITSVATQVDQKAISGFRGPFWFWAREANNAWHAQPRPRIDGIAARIANGSDLLKAMEPWSHGAMGPWGIAS